MLSNRGFAAHMTQDQGATVIVPLDQRAAAVAPSDRGASDAEPPDLGLAVGHAFEGHHCLTRLGGHRHS